MATKKKAAKKPSVKPLKVSDILSSKDFKLLKAPIQAALKAIVNDWTPADLKNLDFSKQDLKAFIVESAKKIDPYYSDNEKELFSSFMEDADNRINAIRVEQRNALMDLEQAKANGDAALTESLKVYTKNLRDTLGDLMTERDTYVGNLNEALDRKVADARDSIKKNFGRISEDEAQALRQIERQYTEVRDNFRNEMQQRGYAFSTNRKKGDVKITNEETDMVSSTQNQANRQRQDTAQSAENAVGTANLQGLGADAYLRGDIVGEDVIATSQEIDRIMRSTGRDMREKLREVEAKFGTGAVQAVADQYGMGGDLYGGVEGEATSANRLAQEGNMRTYQRGLESAVRQYGQDFGTNTEIVDPTTGAKRNIGASTVFNSNFGGFGGYGGIGNVFPQTMTGTGTRGYQTNVRENKFNRAKALSDATYAKKSSLLAARTL